MFGALLKRVVIRKKLKFVPWKMIAKESYATEISDMMSSAVYGLPGIDTQALYSCKVCSKYAPPGAIQAQDLLGVGWATNWLRNHECLMPESVHSLDDSTDYCESAPGARDGIGCSALGYRRLGDCGAYCCRDRQ